jgi:hypothetical protein
MDAKLDLLIQDVRELRAEIFALAKRVEVNNEIIRTHEKRSLELTAENRRMRDDLVPVQEHVKFVSTALKTLGAVLVGVVIQWVARTYF